MFVCKVLLGSEFKGQLKHKQARNFEYSTTLAAGVYPHFLVHVTLLAKWDKTEWDKMAAIPLSSQPASLTTAQPHDGVTQPRNAVTDTHNGFILNLTSLWYADGFSSVKKGVVVIACILVAVSIATKVYLEF
jgi:hypothetical protein